MKLKQIASYIREHGFRGSAVLTADRLLGRQVPEVSYERWLGRNRPSSRDYLKMEKEALPVSPLIGVTASMPDHDRTAFVQSLEMQVYRNFRAMKNCVDPDYVLVVNGPCTLRPDLLWRVAYLLGQPGSDGIDLVYFDSDRICEDGRKGHPAFRPAYDPELLECVNYMGNVVLVRGSLVKGTEIFHNGEDAFYGFLKQVCLEGGGNDLKQERLRVRHIPQILYHDAGEQVSWDESAGEPMDAFSSNGGNAGDRPGSSQEADSNPGNRQGTEDAGDRPGCLDEASLAGQEPLISVLIPNKDHGQDLKRCIKSLQVINTWRNLEILILENNSVQEETFALYRTLMEEDNRIRVLTWEGSFNYAAINNYGASSAKGDYLLLLNNDTRILAPESLRRMEALCQRPQTGAVGALLLYPDGHVQHGGIILGHGGIAGHAWEGDLPQTDLDDYPALVFSHTHNVSAVTGACMMLRRAVWEQEGGMDESLAVTFNDVDLCMRLGRDSFRVLMCPGACLVHDESASRGSEDSREKVARFHKEIGIFVRRWEKELEMGDPCYNPCLTLLGRSWTCKDALRESVKPYVKYAEMFDGREM